MYSFEKSVIFCKPIYTEIIDDEWRKETLQDLDLVIGSAAINTDMSKNYERDLSQRLPTTEAKEWNDLSLEELITKFTDVQEENKE
ncbi:unnamed protein product [Moneuplotes crassus]|uniref:Uncharacterized protein n=1 Tax=Euplotes crassus TaxID=5936 RepID=A0AAD1Y6K9_EUPCR|nr:unnamed protein product [Moneuplotes crassus]